MLNIRLRTRPNLTQHSVQITLGIFLLTASLVGIFQTTKASPSVSELDFIEHSILGRAAGSVIPASCNSSPPTSHFNYDCFPSTKLDFSRSGSPVSYVNVNLSLNPAILPGGISKLTWSSTGATSCTKSWAGGGAVALSGSRDIMWNGMIYYSGSPPAPTETIFTLTCTNGSKTTTKAVRLFAIPILGQGPTGGG